MTRGPLTEMIHSHPESTPSFKKLHMFFMLEPKTNYCLGSVTDVTWISVPQLLRGTTA